jgi:hypothetical protein
MYEEVDERLPERQIVMLQAQNKQIEERFQRQLVAIFGSPKHITWSRTATNGTHQIRIDIPSSSPLGQTRMVNCSIPYPGYSSPPSAPATTTTTTATTATVASVTNGSAASSALSQPPARVNMLEPPRETLESDLSALVAWRDQVLQQPSTAPEPEWCQPPSYQPRVASGPELSAVLAPFVQPGNPVESNDTAITHGDQAQSESSSGWRPEGIDRPGPSADLGLPKGVLDPELEIIKPETTTGPETRTTPEMDMDTPKSSQCPPTSEGPSGSPSEVHDESAVVWTEDQDPELNHFSQLVWGLENDSSLAPPETDNFFTW